MNTLRTPPTWSAGRACVALCAAWLALLPVGANADEIAIEPFHKSSMRAEAMQPKAHRPASGAVSAGAALPASWMSSELVPVMWQREEVTVLRRPSDWFADDGYVATASNFDTSNLFRTRKEQKYRDTLRLLLTKRQLRVWLREDLHVQCEVKRYRSLDEGRELGLKLGVYYRFE